MPLKVFIVPVTQFQQNCSVLVCEATRNAAVIDPGGDLDRVHQVLDKAGATLQKILLTHAHIDHAGATARLAREHAVPIEGPHRGDAFWIEQLPRQSREFGFELAESFTPDRWLEQGDQVTVGECVLDVLHCPGHTPGHLVFFSAAQKFAIVGDVLFAGSIGRTDFPGGNHEQLIESIRGRLWPLGDEVVFVPGHGPRSTFGRERRSNPYVADGV